MTIRDFKRDIESRTCRYASLGEEDRALPVQATLHISDVIAVGEYPAVILFTDGGNMMQLNQVQSIERVGDHYEIICGETDDLRTCVTVHFDCPHQ